jgi:hypothetical protein
MAFLEWLRVIGTDADPTEPGFQARGVYLIVCVMGPVLFGIAAALIMDATERIFGVKLSSGGH